MYSRPGNTVMISNMYTDIHSYIWRYLWIGKGNNNYDLTGSNNNSSQDYDKFPWGFHSNAQSDCMET